MQLQRVRSQLTLASLLRSPACVRDYIHVMDLAGGHVNALDAIDSEARFQNLPSRGKYRAFNLGRGQGMSVLNMIEAMRKVTGWSYPYEIIGRRPGDVPDLTADPTLAEKELGFKAKHGLDEMARDLWNCEWAWSGCDEVAVR